jgi:hypothetical protein
MAIGDKQVRITHGSDQAGVERLGRQLGEKWGQFGSIADPDSDRVPQFVSPGPILASEDWYASLYYARDADTALQNSAFVTMTFNLRRPLRPQLRTAKSVLTERRTHFPVARPSRASIRLCGLYLRVLDAKRAGASTKAIIKAIGAYRQLDNTAASGYAATDRVSDHYKYARELMANPLQLL